MESSKDKTLNVKHNLMMEVLTPLHIGAGAEKDWVLGSDFIVVDGKVKVLNINKVATVIGVENLTNALLKKDDKFLRNKLAGNLNDCVEKEFNVNFSGSNDIKTFIKNGLTNKPIVPGSSVKGALRSIIAKHLLNGSKSLNEQSLFGKANDGDEFMRFIKVTDSAFSTTSLIKTRVFKLNKDFDGSWKTGSFENPEFCAFYEIIPSGSKSILSLNIAEKSFDNFNFKELYQTQKRKAEKIEDEFIKRKQIAIVDNLIKLMQPKSAIINEKNFGDFFLMINQHTKNYLEKEKAFFEKYNQADNTDKIIVSIDNLLELINQAGDKYCILKMAAGSGFHSITGDWQFDDYSIDSIDGGDRNRGKLNGKKSAKSRKIAIHDGKFELMGFVKLSLATDEEVSNNEELLRKSVDELNSILIAKEAEKVKLADRLQAEKDAELKRQQEENLRIAEELARIEAEKQAAIKAQIAEEKRIEEERRQEELRKLAIIENEKENEKHRKEVKQQLASQGFQAFCSESNSLDIKKFKDLENIAKRYLNFLKENIFPNSDLDFLQSQISNIYEHSGGFERK